MNVQTAPRTGGGYRARVLSTLSVIISKCIKHCVKNVIMMLDFSGNTRTGRFSTCVPNRIHIKA